MGQIRPRERVKARLEIVAGVDLRDSSLRFRFPFTRAPAYHVRMRAIETENGGGPMELPEDEFGDVLLLPFLRDATGCMG